ncbi:MAG: RidA family protein [Planctomycetota bacterium]
MRKTIVLLAALSGCAAPRTDHLPAAPGALGPYSAAVSSGDLVHLSGKIGKRGGAFAEELGTAIDAVEADLRAVGLGLEDVLSVNVFVTDMELYTELNKIYGERFPRPYPARTTVGVASLPGGARVEIQAVARRRRG